MGAALDVLAQLERRVRAECFKLRARVVAGPGRRGRPQQATGADEAAARLDACHVAEVEQPAQLALALLPLWGVPYSRGAANAEPALVRSASAAR